MKINFTDKAVSHWERGIGFPDITSMLIIAITVCYIWILERRNG